MKPIRMLVVGLTMVVWAVTAEGQTTRPSKQYTIDQFLNTTAITGASFSADESRILLSSNKTGIWNIYTVPATGGTWTPVTRSTTDSTYAVSFFPKDDRILFTRDQGGNELNHLYVLTKDGQEVWIGQHVRSKIRAETFRRWFFVGLLLLGVYLALRPFV